MNEHMKKVLCPVENEKTGKTHWLRVGAAFSNRDGSTNVYLSAYPANGKLQIRDFDESDRKRSANANANTDNALPF